MSADNGIVILQSLRDHKNSKHYEYRVVHTQNLEGLEFSELRLAKHVNSYLERVFVEFHECKVHKNYKSALREAYGISVGLEICEYGIVSILAPLTFKEYEKAFWVLLWEDRTESIFKPHSLSDDFGRMGFDF